MNDFHMISLANSSISERRAEADRSRLARLASADTETSGSGVAGAPRQSRRSPRLAIAWMFGRVALY